MFAIAEHSAASLDDGENETYTCERIMRKVVEKMKLLVVAGPPSSGKTSVILQLIADLGVPRGTAGVVKFDCLTSFDHLRYREAGVPVVTGFSGATCPDHYFVSNIEDAVAWGKKKGLEWLITESVGLCNRCSPYINGVPAICVIDAIAGVNTPPQDRPHAENGRLCYHHQGGYRQSGGAGGICLPCAAGEYYGTGAFRERHNRAGRNGIKALCAAGPGVRYLAGKEAAFHYAIGGMQLLHRGTAHRGKLPDGNVKENGV